MKYRKCESKFHALRARIESSYLEGRGVYYIIAA